VITLLVNTSQLAAQSSPQELIYAAWNVFATDSKKADSLAYQALEMVTNELSTPDQTYANLFFLLGTLELEKKRYRISVDFLDRAIKTDFIKKNKAARQKCLNNMGASLASIGKIPEALLAFQEAMELSKELHDQTSIENLWINIAELECELGEYEVAIAYAEKALEAAKEGQDTLKTAKCHLNLGKYFSYLEMYEEGEKNTLKASQLFEQLNERNLLSAALINLSELEHLKGKYESSNRLLQRVIVMSADNPEAVGLSPVYRQLAENAVSVGTDVHKAAGYCLRAIRLAELSGRRDYLEEAMLVLSKYYSKVNDFNNFSRTIDRYNETKKETVTLNAKAASEELKIIYQTNQLASENRDLKLEVRANRNQFLLSFSGFMIASFIGTVIFLQHRKLKRNMKTMLQMNLSLAYSKQRPSEIEEVPEDLPSEQETELSDSELYLIILRKIEHKELFKNPQFGLQDLAREVKRNRKHVSRAIRNVGKTNFAGLINEFKVNEARKLIMEQNGTLPMGDVATAAGFNSRISFNRHFKEFTGFTPTDYLSRLQKTAAAGIEEEEDKED
jgi:AraC-like DNA-binding protein